MSETHTGIIVETCAECNGDCQIRRYDTDALADKWSDCKQCTGLGKVFVSKTYRLLEKNEPSKKEIDTFSVSKFVSNDD